MYLKTLIVKLTFISVVGLMAAGCDSPNNTGEKTQADSSNTTIASAREISRAIEKEPQNAELYYKRSSLYYTEKYLDRALDDIDEAVRLSIHNPLYHYHRARVLYAMNRTQEAAKSYEAAIEVKPDYDEAKMRLAELYYIVKEHTKSVDLLNAVIATNPNHADAYFFKGMNLKETGDTARAIAAFQRSFESDKNNYDAAMQLGILYTAKGDKYAYDYLTAATKMQPKNPEAYFARAYYYQTKKEFQKALFDYRKVIDLDPSNDAAYYNVGYINYDVKQYNEALRAWNICIQMNNNNINAYYMRGLVHEMKGNKEEAKLNYDYVLQLDPEYELAKIRLARLR